MNRVSKDIVYKDINRYVSYELSDSESYLSDLTRESRDRIESTLYRTEHGFSRDLVSPLIGRDSTDYDGVRAKIKDNMLSKVTPSGIHELDVAEYDQADLWGPWSIQLPYIERLPEIERFFSVPKQLTVDWVTLEKAISKVASAFPIHEVVPLSLDAAFDEMPRGTNLGAPFHSKDSKYYPQVIQLAKDVIANGYSDIRDDPCVLYWRGQARGLGEPPKQRTVWGYPHYITLLELMLQGAALPLLQMMPEMAALKSTTFVDDVMTILLRRARRSKINLLSVDFSGYDMTLLREIIKGFFAILRYMFVKSASRLIDFVENRFFNIPLLGPLGILRGEHGVPSGAGVTNWCDSICNWIFWEYVMLLTDNSLSTVTFQGDDGVILPSQPWELEEFRGIGKSLGMVISSEKGGVSQLHSSYLQNIHHVDYLRGGRCVGVRPIMRALNGALSFESPRSEDWLPADNTIRWLQQGESCKWHPKLIELARFLRGHDKLISNGVNTSELLAKAHGLSKAEIALKQDSFPYGKAPISKLNEFTIVKVINSLKGRSS